MERFANSLAFGRSNVVKIAAVGFAVFIPSQAEATILTFNGLLSGMVNGVSLTNVPETILMDNTNGAMNIQAGPFSPTLASSMRGSYPLANKGWTGMTITFSTNSATWASLGLAPPVNCLGLTNGNLHRAATYSFSSGQSLTEVTDQHRVDATTFAFTTTFGGTLPTLPTGSDFQWQNFSGSFTQFNQTTLRSVYNSGYMADLNNTGVLSPGTMTGTADITYNGVAQMPYAELENGSNIVTSVDSNGVVHYSSLTSVTPAVVPEPCSLLALPGLALLTLRRRRSGAAAQSV